MPFVGELEGELVTPEEVQDNVVLTCSECGGDLRVRRTHERNGNFVARHFWHPEGGSGCSGGESATHRRLKSIALSKVKRVIPFEDAGFEKMIGENIADVYATFAEPVGKYGEGVVIEVQHKNEDKDIERVSKNYLREGYSVCWISDVDIDGRDIDLSEPEWRYVGELEEPDDDSPQIEYTHSIRPEDNVPGPDEYDCLNCPGSIEPISREHAYKGGQVYRCGTCDEYYIKEDNFGERRIVRVTHEGNLKTHSRSEYYPESR